jgi:hypothetical protein
VGQMRCDNPKCRARNNRALWMVDGHLRCNHCLEVHMETHSYDECRIVRLSDDWREFPEPDIKYQDRAKHA